MSKGVLLVTSKKQAETCKAELSDYQKGWIVVNTGGQITEPSSPEPVTILHNGEVEEHWILRKGKDTLLDYLKGLSSQGLPFVLAGDGSIETEKIASDIKQLVPDSNVRVTIIRSLKAEDIVASISHQRSVDHYMARAAEIRKIIDILIGYKLGGIMNWHLRQSGYMIPPKLKIGRLMGIALKILCDNQRSIDEHESEEFIRLKCWYRKDNAHFEIVDKTRFFTDDFNNMAQKKELKRKLAGNKHVVISHIQKQREESPPEPLHHSSLQVACNNHYRYRGEDTVRLAKELYESGYITNYKTNSNHISEEVYEKMLVYLYATENEDTIVDIKRRYKNKEGVNEEEIAIVPTEFSSETSPSNIMLLWNSKGEEHLHKDHLKVYSMIWYRTLATQIENAFFDSTEMTLEISDHRMKIVSNKALIGYDLEGNQKEMKGWLGLNEFLLRGSITLAEDAWLVDDVEIPEYNVGDVAKCVDITEVPSGTQPPKRYGEGRFIRALEKLNIAQPSSLPALVKGLVDKGFVEYTGAVLVVRALGKRVDEWLSKHAPFLHDIEKTVAISENLRRIERGEHPEPEDVIRSVYMNIKKVSDEVGYEELHENEKPTYLQIEQARSIAREKRIQLGEKIFESKEAIEVFLRSHGVLVEEVELIEQDILGKCPECQKGSVLRKEKFYGCSDYSKSQCKFGLNIEYSLKFLERFGINDVSMEYLDTIVSGLLAKDYVEIKNMRSKNNITFTGKVTLTKRGNYWNIGLLENNS